MDGESFRIKSTQKKKQKKKQVERDGDVKSTNDDDFRIKSTQKKKQKKKQVERGGDVKSPNDDEQKQVERDGDVKRPNDDEQKPMELEGDDGEGTSIVEDIDDLEFDRQSSDPFPCVLRGEPIDVMDILFSHNRKCLICNDGRKVHRRDLRGKTIVFYLVPLNVITPNEPCSTPDIIDAYNAISKITKYTVFVFVGVHIEYASHYQPEQEASKDQEAYFNHLFSVLPFPTIPFSDKEARQGVAKAFKLHLVPPLMYEFLPYWSIIDPYRTVVASITDPGCLHLFHYYPAEELHPLTRKHIRTVISPSGRPRDMLSNLDQLLESFNCDKVLVSTLKDKVVGFYICDQRPNPLNMNLIQKVCKEAEDRHLDFLIVQICVQFYPTYDLIEPIYLREPQSVSEQQTINWLKLPFEDPRCKKLLRIFTDVFGYDDGAEAVYGRLVIFQPKRDTFELSGVEILQEYGIEGYPFTRKCLFEVEKKIVKETMKLPLLFPRGKHNLKKWDGDKYVPVDNDTLYKKDVLVFFALPEALKYRLELIVELEKRYKGGRFEVVYVSFDEDCDEASMSDEGIRKMPWLVYSYSLSFKNDLLSKLFKSAKFHDYPVGVAAFGVDGELITKCYRFSALFEDGAGDFPFLSVNLEDAICEEVYTICQLDKYSAMLDVWYPPYPLLEDVFPKYDESEKTIVYPVW